MKKENAEQQQHFSLKEEDGSKASGNDHQRHQQQQQSLVKLEDESSASKYDQQQHQTNIILESEMFDVSVSSVEKNINNSKPN